MCATASKTSNVCTVRNGDTSFFSLSCRKKKKSIFVRLFVNPRQAPLFSLSLPLSFMKFSRVFYTIRAHFFIRLTSFLIRRLRPCVDFSIALCFTYAPSTALSLSIFRFFHGYYFICWNNLLVLAKLFHFIVSFASITLLSGRLSTTFTHIIFAQPF